MSYFFALFPIVMMDLFFIFFSPIVFSSSVVKHSFVLRLEKAKSVVLFVMMGFLVTSNKRSWHDLFEKSVY